MTAKVFLKKNHVEMLRKNQPVIINVRPGTTKLELRFDLDAQSVGQMEDFMARLGMK